MKRLLKGALWTVLAAIAISAPAYAANPCATHSAATCAPCDLISKILGLVNGGLGQNLDEDIRSFINLLNGDVADLDGDFLIDDTGESLVASLTGDDIKDISCQMTIIYRIMSNPNTFPAGSAIPSAELNAAFDANLQTLRTKIGEGSDGIALFDLLLPQLIPFLTYLSLIGSPEDSVIIESSDPIKTSGHGTLGIIQALFALLDGVEVNGTTLDFADPTVSPGDFIVFGDKLGANRDLDGDGFTNICEFRHFRRFLCNANFPNLYTPDDITVDSVTAILDPTIKPVGCYEVIGPDDDCTFLMGSEQVVPPSTTDAIGSVRLRKFTNSVTGATKYQANILHTVTSKTPKGSFYKGRAGEAGTEVLVAVPGDITPIWWELFIGPANYQKLKTTPNYFEVTGPNSDDPPVQQTIRGNNTCPGFAPPPPVPHSADTDKNFIIDLSEFMLITQMMNSDGLHCDGAGGYAAGSGDQSCAPHDSDYNLQDWKISLPELLRLIQLFSAGKYDECFGGATSEDGYCIAVP